MNEMQPQPLISLARAVIVRNGRRVLDHVDLTVGRGEIVTVVGPNGAGKSTLIRALLGLEALDEGEVRRAAGLSVAYLPQRHHLDPALPLSVRRLLTLTHPAPEERLHQVLDELGIGQLLDSSALRLSGGELQRVMLARALLRDSDLLVLDEPTQNVDASGAIDIYQVIAAQRARSGCGVLLVSHDLNVVMAATDRVYCLNGHICCSGKPSDVERDRAFVELFGEAAARTLAPYTHHHDHVHGPDGAVAGDDHSDGPHQSHNHRPHEGHHHHP